MKLGIIGAGRIGAHHVGVLQGLPDIETLYVTDVLPGAADRLADTDRVAAVASPADVLRSGIDGVVVASSTPTHPELILAAIEARIPTFCEKPVAADPRAAQALLDQTRDNDVPVHIGFHRRFDPGHVRAKQALQSGSLGFVHTIRSMVMDPAPPPADYIAVSGGIYHDCSVHDIDAIRWVSDSQVVEVFATGGNRGEAFFSEAGDVDTSAVILTLDDGTLGIISNSRYNGGGYDVRLELHGSRGAVVAGLDDRYAMRSVERGVTFPHGTPATFFMDRFKEAYVDELSAFLDVIAGRRESPCTIADAVETSWVAEACTVSRRENRPVRLEELRRSPHP